MVKAWAAGLVDEYETGFAHKIDWEAAKQRAMNPNMSVRSNFMDYGREGWLDIPIGGSLFSCRQIWSRNI